MFQKEGRWNDIITAQIVSSSAFQVVMKNEIRNIIRRLIQVIAVTRIYT